MALETGAIDPTGGTEATGAIDPAEAVSAPVAASSPSAGTPPKSGRVSPAKSRHKGPRPKHIPQRMCVACRERDSKRALTRIVRTPEGEVVIDPTGKRNGRGSYLCDNPGCWEKAIKGGLLTRALNTTLTAEAIETLRQRAASLRAAQQAEQGHQAPRQQAAPAGS
jgi:predicted RNA-binding protein YlxR (DUF448 family)